MAQQSRNMKSKILTYALAIGCILLAVLYLQQCGRANESDLLRDSAQSARIAERNHSLQEIRVRDRHIQAVLNERDSVIKYSTQKEVGLKSQINRLKSKILIPSNSGVLKVSDTCRIQLVLRDSIIEAQDTLILTLETEKAEIIRMDSIAFDSLKSNVSQFRELFESEANETVKLEKKLDRQKRVGKWIKGALAVAIGWIIIDKVAE